MFRSLITSPGFTHDEAERQRNPHNPGQNDSLALPWLQRFFIDTGTTTTQNRSDVQDPP
jgi:hypothetical protein